MSIDRLYQSPAGTQWKSVGAYHHHGIALPLFSLHSEKSSGIGEYTDLLPLLAWCRDRGFDILQLLPLNDTGLETSPYMALSAFALHPLYIGLHKLPFVERVSNCNEKLQILRSYNQSKRVQYAEVGRLKREFLQEYAKHTYQEISSQTAYQQFQEQNKYWLESYALFKALKEKQGFKSWEEWDEREKNPTTQTYAELVKEHQESISFHIFLQYLAFSQLAEVKKVASEQKIYIKGDIPILLSRDSADVWMHRSYFLLNLAAGSPPDMYAKEGQYWGFPVYDWEAQEKKGFDFWKERLRCASQIYHLYRLDHVVGFFRLWAIPLHKKALAGSFIPVEEKQWVPLGKKILEMMLSAVPLLPIAEDLGTIPPSTRICLQALGIPGTKVMRWERKWDAGGDFIPPSEYLPESMTTVSTHDSETLQLWWKNTPQEAARYAAFKKWDYQPTLSLEHHFEILQDSHRSNSLFHINLLQEYLALIPELVSTDLNEERINIPGIISENNWTYRFLPSIEALQNHTLLHQTIKKLIKN